MSKEYFEKCKQFEKGLSKRINKFLSSICADCPHQQDKHSMNCIECCPLHGILGKMIKKAHKLQNEK
jgi:hypothetical protein